MFTKLLENDDLSRRRLLEAAGTASLLAVAGCTSGGGESTPDPTATETETATATPKAEGGETGGAGDPGDDGGDGSAEPDGGPEQAAAAWFSAFFSGDDERVSELTHPRTRSGNKFEDISIEEQNRSVDEVTQVPAQEVRTGALVAPEMDVEGVEEILADGDAAEVAWVHVSLAGEERDAYVPLLRDEGRWLYYEAGGGE